MSKSYYTKNKDSFTIWPLDLWMDPCSLKVIVSYN